MSTLDLPTGDFTEMLTLRVKAVQEVNNNNNDELTGDELTGDELTMWRVDW